MEKNTAWVLAVVSDVGQAESLPHRIEWAEQTAQVNGWTITHALGIDDQKGLDGPQEPEVEIVRQVFKLRAEGLGCYVISKQLRSLAPPMQRREGARRKINLNPDYVARMVKKREYVDAGLIDEVTWHSAQVRDKKLKVKPRRFEWPLTGALKCECACRDRKNVHGGLRAHPKAQIEEQFLALLRRLRTVPSVAALTQNRSADDGERRKLLMKKLTQLRAELAQIPSSIERVWAAFDAGTYLARW